jgi:hypothetical protein
MVVKEVHHGHSSDSRHTHSHYAIHVTIHVATRLGCRHTQGHCVVRTIVLVATPKHTNISISIMKYK